MATRLRQHFERLGTKPAGGSQIHADDALLVFMHTGERIRGKANIDAAHQAYPGRPSSFDVHRVTCSDSVAVVEMTLRFAGTDPHPVVAVLDLRDDEVVMERRYVAEPDEPAAYRVEWVESAATPGDWPWTS